MPSGSQNKKDSASDQRSMRSRDNSPVNNKQSNKKKNVKDEELVDILNNTEDLSEISETDQSTKILQLLRFIANSQTEISKSINDTKADISDLKAENKALTSRITVLEEQNIRMDQYSRKGVMTVSGFKIDTLVPQDQLATEVVDMLNTIAISRPALTCQDFAAIHRNSKEGKDGKPPTITVKFLRYTDKQKFFTKSAISNRKKHYRGVGFHHNMCPALISEQNNISNHQKVKFATYMGDNRWFSVCLNDGNFLNYIRSFKHFSSSLAEHEASKFAT